jgi:hypothetical protein
VAGLTADEAVLHFYIIPRNFYFQSLLLASAFPWSMAGNNNKGDMSP